ncbi:MAG: TadE/TadG family type IV pilus assembly protein [Candidatus Methylacidiphilales bacterium]|nr:TadE/TadG family type IV pilus assembly protein [Candidatus Methylacidiphilales bacterium]
MRLVSPSLRSPRCSKGSTLVEFALVFVVFTICLMGLLDLGRYLYTKQRMAHMLRAGIRASTVYDPLQAGNTLTRREVFVNALKSADGNFLLRGVSLPTVSANQTSSDALVLTPSDAGTYGSSVVAQLKLPFTYVTPLIKMVGAASSSKSLDIQVTIQSTNEP